MSDQKRAVRHRFQKGVFARDKHRCKVCGDQTPYLDPHHITDRSLLPNGGYALANGISLCPPCHEKAEVFHQTGAPLPGFSPEDLYALIGSSYEEALDASRKLI